ncbi:MAG: hypothetical protein TYPL_4820 [Candidatus Tyloplasma litorale]|nr:MAG: hypothetical protein TYPL_4820 [Mycoplasmatales bacterium]
MKKTNNIISYTINNNHNPTTWIIWGVLTSIMLLILISSIIISIFFYRKYNKKFLTIKKITILATFLAIFLVQAFLTKITADIPFLPSVDSVTTIVVGFIFGPLEGILFGWIADSLNTLIHGWSYEVLPSLMFPMIGLISGLFGVIYKKVQDIPIWKSILIFQVIAISLLFIMIPLEIFLTNVNINGNSISEEEFQKALFFSITSFIFIELMMLYIRYYKLNGKEIILLMLILCVSFSERMMELVIRPFTQYFSGYEKSYLLALYTRILRSTYLIPLVAIISFLLIRLTQFAMKNTQR